MEQNRASGGYVAPAAVTPIVSTNTYANTNTYVSPNTYAHTNTTAHVPTTTVNTNTYAQPVATTSAYRTTQHEQRLAAPT